MRFVCCVFSVVADLLLLSFVVVFGTVNFCCWWLVLLLLCFVVICCVSQLPVGIVCILDETSKITILHLCVSVFCLTYPGRGRGGVFVTILFQHNSVYSTYVGRLPVQDFLGVIIQRTFMWPYIHVACFEPMGVDSI